MAPPRAVTDVRRRRGRRAFVLPAVLLFLAVAFGMWAIVFRGSANALRVEEARAHRDARESWTAPATAAGLRLLETGRPPLDTYTCKLALTQDGLTRYFLLTYDKIGPTRWTLQCTPTDAADATLDAPATFATVPDAPGTLTATTASSSQINLAWGNVTGETGYAVEQSGTGTDGWTQIGTAAKNATSYAVTGLANNRTYYFRVCATNAQGNGDYSNTAGATTQAFGTPAAPSGLTVTVTSANSLQLNWNDNSSGESGFLIYRSTDGSTWSLWTSVSANATSKTNSGLTTGQTYHYRVQAYNSFGNSAFSNPASATPQ
jgi:hypothetical protein